MDRRDNNSAALRAQIEAGGHGGLSPGDLADYRHQIETGPREFERVAVTIRRCALQHAVEVVGGCADPGVILDAAAKFEAFLVGAAPGQTGDPEYSVYSDNA